MTARAYHCRDGIEDDIHVPNLFFKPGSPIAIASSTPSQLTKSVVSQLGQKLVATIPPKYSWPLEFHVVAKKEIKTFALPEAAPCSSTSERSRLPRLKRARRRHGNRNLTVYVFPTAIFWQLFLSSP